VGSGFEDGYVFARICGSLSKAWLGDRAVALSRHNRVGEAWRLLFGGQPPALPETALLAEAERETKARALASFRALAGELAERPFFAALLRKPEFAYVKKIAVAVVERAPALPLPDDPGASPSFSPSGYPDLDKMFRRSRYEWILEQGLGDLAELKNRLDRQYYAELWESLHSLPAARRGSIPALLRLEAELENLVWSLRLRRYYAMNAAEIEPRLIALRGVDVRRAALDALGRRPDLRSEWNGWRWERLLPDKRTPITNEWYLDVRDFESAARRYLFRKLFGALHVEPFAYTPLYAFFRIKEHETAAIHGILEGLHLEAPAAEIAAFAMDATGGPA